MKPDRDEVIIVVAELDENPIAGSRLDRDRSYAQKPEQMPPD